MHGFGLIVIMISKYKLNYISESFNRAVGWKLLYKSWIAGEGVYRLRDVDLRNSARWVFVCMLNQMDIRVKGSGVMHSTTVTTIIVIKPNCTMLHNNYSCVQ